MLTLGALPGAASAQSFTLIPPAPGDTSTRAHGVSADGSVVAGTSYYYQGAWTWTREGGRHDIMLDPGLPPLGEAVGVSGDGRTVVGASPQGPAIYSGPGTFQNLPLLGPIYTSGRATDASYDGSVVVGYNDDGNGAFRAFRWTAADGAQALDYLLPSHWYSIAAAVSADGNIIVGSSGNSSDVAAVVWNRQLGMQRLPGFGQNYSEAYGVSSDGRFVVGYSGGPFLQATLWRDGSVQALGFVEGTGQTRAYAVSDDGNVVVRYAAFNNRDAAFIWTPQTGMMELKVYLRTLGIDLPSTVNPYMATGISADGKTIVGYTGSWTAAPLAFVVTIPSPGVLTPLGLVGLMLARRRR